MCMHQRPEEPMYVLLLVCCCMLHAVGLWAAYAGNRIRLNSFWLFVLHIFWGISMYAVGSDVQRMNCAEQLTLWRVNLSALVSLSCVVFMCGVCIHSTPILLVEEFECRVETWAASCVFCLYLALVLWCTWVQPKCIHFTYICVCQAWLHKAPKRDGN